MIMVCVCKKLQITTAHLSEDVIVPHSLSEEHYAVLSAVARAPLDCEGQGTVPRAEPQHMGVVSPHTTHPDRGHIQRDRGAAGKNKNTGSLVPDSEHS